MKLVRLFPRDPERGWLIQTYVDPQLGLKFVAARGWYIVEDEVAEALAEVRQQDYKPRSPKAFLIAEDKAEARKFERTILAPPEKEEESIGTADVPVPVKRAMRPGKRKPAKKASNARIRKRSTTVG